MIDFSKDPEIFLSGIERFIIIINILVLSSQSNEAGREEYCVTVALHPDSLNHT
jgi:hypothetical protein